ncbi:MAG TPA: lysylphosphatidylglycerol synthase transmembrane domain-containing protein [Gaiellaceae bacterium]|nr:lysylphosphatidylglycerol synthase transmembrane domain-containing protein [Gaiellaceae bacterium]
MGRVAAIRRFADEHHRLLAAAQIVVVAVFLFAIGWAVRGTLEDAGDDLRNADPVDFALALAAIAGYYLLFVLGWMRILSDWGMPLGYTQALQSEMVSMLAKYVPGGVWTPAARVVAARRYGVTDAGLVTASMLVEAGTSAVAGVLVFVVSLTWTGGVGGWTVPLVVAFGVLVAVLVHPRVFQPLSTRVLRRLGHPPLPPLRGPTLLFLLAYYAFTWVVGGVGLWLLLRSVGDDASASTIVFLGGTSCVGAIVAVLVVIAPSGLGVREGSMYGVLLAITSEAHALSAVALNRVAITVVEIALALVGGLLLRGRSERQADGGAPGVDERLDLGG